MRKLIGFCATAVLLVACAGTQPATSQSQLLIPSSPNLQSNAACPDARAGEVRCYVRIQSLGAIGRAIAGWTPADFQARYNLPSATKGSGQIVAVVTAYDNPNAASDLAAYRAQFGLAAGAFEKFNQNGEMQNYPRGNTGWGTEIDLDIEMVAATCPLCTIYLVEANSSKSVDLEAAERTAVKLGSHIVSNSWGCTGSLKCVNRKDFDHKGVTYLAASGDQGSNQVGLPAAFTSVVSVGGTVLSKNGSQYTEQIYNIAVGGCATGIKKPIWQHDTFCAYRLANDAGAVAANVASFDTYGYAGWLTLSGTSVSTPLLAGMFGLAGNATKQRGGRTFWQARHRKYLYALSGSCNGGYTMGQYTTCAGWGSPNGIGAL